MLMKVFVTSFSPPFCRLFVFLSRNTLQQNSPALSTLLFSFAVHQNTLTQQRPSTYTESCDYSYYAAQSTMNQRDILLM